MTKRPHANLELIRRVLGSDYLELTIEKMTLEENVEDNTSSVTLRLADTQGNSQDVVGHGVGLIDALFAALLERYAVEYQSLKSIELASFSVTAKLDTKKAKAGVDAVGEVSLDVRNSEGTMFSFSDASRSITASAARSVLAAVEYFVNAERAFVTLYRSRQDAKERHRDDLVTRYTAELAEVVKSTSYAELIESIKKEL